MEYCNWRIGGTCKKTCKPFLEYNFGVNLKHAKKNYEKYELQLKFILLKKYIKVKHWMKCEMKKWRTEKGNESQGIGKCEPFSLYWE